MAASDNLNKALFHASRMSPAAFMKAPLLHVGTRQAARDIQTVRRLPPTITKLYPSRYAEVHPEVLSDVEANEAHRQFAEARNYPVHDTVAHSAFPRTSVDSGGQRVRKGEVFDLTSSEEVPNYDTAVQKQKVENAVKALSENKILQYENFAEDSGSISYIVPSPHMNLRRKGKKDPMEQPVLPMDYSGVAPSNKTLSYRYGLPWSNLE